MANRLTASEKWQDPWFCGLNPQDKLFWFYLLDNCNHAGIWIVNWALAKFHLGNYIFNEPAFNGRIIKLSDEKWFIPNFIKFQYPGELNPKNTVHASVIKILKKEGALKGLQSPLQGSKDKDKDMDTVSNNKIDTEIQSKKDNNNFKFIWDQYPSKIGLKDAERHFRVSVKTEQDFKDIQAALQNYKNSKRVKDGIIQNGSTWFNNWRDWIDYKDPVKKNDLNFGPTASPEKIKLYGQNTVRINENGDLVNTKGEIVG